MSGRKKRRVNVTEKKVLADKCLEHTIWKVWAYVRMNRDRLDPEVPCKEVQAMVATAVREYQDQFSEAVEEYDRVRKELTSTKGALTNAKKKIVEYKREEAQRRKDQRADTRCGAKSEDVEPAVLHSTGEVSGGSF